jgi:hypothetical protein
VSVRKAAVVHAVEIYDGRDRLGEVQELVNGQHRAMDRHDREIGLFDSLHKARAAIIGLRNGRAI